MRNMDRQLVDAVRAAAQPLEWAASDFDPLLERIGDARVVLLGEASHGTHEFYRARAELTARLIEEKGFEAVAVEADWPDAYRVNRYVRAVSDDPDAERALAGFQRFPTWMWRNTDVVDFVGWLRDYNEALPAGRNAVGFYGMDLYALYTSIAAVVEYLETVDPALAADARRRYACFEHFGEDSQAYGYAAHMRMTPACEEEAVQQLTDLRRRADELSQRDGRIPEDEFFYAEQNARLVVNAEAYYRAMFGGRATSWNLRDRHMTETLAALRRHLAQKGGQGRIVVWAHNSHLGDARATEMGAGGELNVGQLVRESWPQDCVLIGFTTDHGTVTAATDWDGAAERKRVRPALADSYEAVFHAAGINRFLLVLNDDRLRALDEARLERAIGVIYRPQTERVSHYFSAHLRRQFDAVLHYDRTRAVEPLEPSPRWTEGEVPETFPHGV